MRVFVTGGSGFVGSNLVKSLVQQGHQVSATLAGGENDLPKEVRPIFLGLSGIDWGSVHGCDVVFHLAANNDTRCKDRQQMMIANVFDTLDLFKKMHELGCSKFVYASSTAVYGNSEAPYFEDKTPLNPLNIYAESKKIMEEMLAKFSQTTGSTVIGLRYCNVYGPGEGHKGRRMSMIGQILRKLSSNQKIKLFKNGEQRRDWVYVDDVVRANMMAMYRNVSWIYNVGSGKSVTFNEIVNESLRQLRLAGNIEKYVDYIEHPFPEEYQNHTECDIKKARGDLNYVPFYDIQLGITKYLENLSVCPF